MANLSGNVELTGVLLANPTDSKLQATEMKAGDISYFLATQDCWRIFA